MFRTHTACCLLILVTLPGALRAAADDDPIVGGTKKRVSEWVALLKEEDPKRRLGALIGLELAGPKPRAVIPAICKTLTTDADADVRVSAAQLLARMQPRAEDAKVDMREAIEALKTVVALESADKDERVREAAATALGKMGPEARVAVKALTAALKDKHKGTQIAAADAIARLDTDADKALPEMIELLKDKSADPYARSSAASFVSRIAGPDDSVAPLLEVLAETDAPVGLRKSVIEAVDRCKEAAGSAGPLLAKALKDKHVDIRIAAAAALGKIGSGAKVALPELRAALKDDDKIVRCQAFEALAKLGSDAADAVPDMITGLKNEKVLDVRLAAIKSLGELGPLARDAVGLLKEAAESSQTAIREAATEALKKIQGS